MRFIAVEIDVREAKNQHNWTERQVKKKIIKPSSKHIADKAIM